MKKILLGVFTIAALSFTSCKCNDTDTDATTVDTVKVDSNTNSVDTTVIKYEKEDSVK